MNPQPSGGEPELRAELLAEREVLNTRLVNLELDAAAKAISGALPEVLEVQFRVEDRHEDIGTVDESVTLRDGRTINAAEDDEFVQDVWDVMMPHISSDVLEILRDRGKIHGADAGVVRVSVGDRSEP